MIPESCIKESETSQSTEWFIEDFIPLVINVISHTSYYLAEIEFVVQYI